MRNYTTQMDAARKGILTPEIKTVAEKEHMDEDKLMKLVAEGKVAICANKNHTCLSAEGVGSMLRTKINVNLGVSRDCKDYDVEMKKVMSAVNLGAEAIMDLSSHGDTQPFRRKLTSECPVMIGTVPVYDSVIHYQRSGNSVCTGIFYRCDTNARRRWRGLCYASLRDHTENHRTDQETQEKDEYRQPRRKPGICLDEHDWRGKSVL